jgi:hypothetical protein
VGDAVAAGRRARDIDDRGLLGDVGNHGTNGGTLGE